MQGDRTAAVVAVEKLHALAAGLVPAAGAEGSDPSPSRTRVPAKAHKVRPSNTDDVGTYRQGYLLLGCPGPWRLTIRNLPLAFWGTWHTARA
jgi:hypothetical protein